MSGTQLKFGLLGPLLLTVAGATVALGTPKQRALFAMLLINRNRAIGSDSLVYAAWDESPVPAARTSIQSYVSNLRKLLGTAGVDPYSVLASVPPGYRLNVAANDCDLDRFNDQKNTGFQAAAAGRFDVASRHLSAALSEWRGPVLADLADFAFVKTFATAVTEDHMLVVTTRAEVEIACGRAEAIIGELETLAARHPYREPLWAQLITAYYVCERQSDALDAYRRLKTALAEDLGIDPGPTINALHARILRQERLRIRQSARTTAARAMAGAYAVASRKPAAAWLRDATGRHHPLRAGATRIGRLSDNDIVLNDDDVSRHHAVIVDTGGSFVMTDLGSANGVQVQGQLLRHSANLADGDHISICGHDFIFEIQ
ncbi:BTAD domain-containing putative transcriptional regulator [Mycobacterium bourgelatii]|uniref:Transcriptional regulatory protein EmbR n=1 Tax=Mycobacterium bourgelatii TaxID=1273442 RepID=A0A7I9YXP1_MYCBU|nr:BTAD domain-containing putative transcriptional regulator [Mycobacterium bourgelatii]MCV6972978.1 FHA domain-containing protein [Mycobacterium bourgelatii]GFG93494.1 transcriptional regulatory protein EmbR [Mycobacterium bourgelatii]